jgi:hypothetical protein
VTAPILKPQWIGVLLGVRSPEFDHASGSVAMTYDLISQQRLQSWIRALQR